MRRREAKREQEAEQLNWYKSFVNKEWDKDKSSWSEAMMNWDRITDEVWATFPEEKEQKISSTVIEEDELPYTYKNYIYRENNWKCPICSIEDHCRHYYCALCKGIHLNDQAYKMRLS